MGANLTKAKLGSLSIGRTYIKTTMIIVILHSRNHDMQVAALHKDIQFSEAHHTDKLSTGNFSWGLIGLAIISHIWLAGTQLMYWNVAKFDQIE